jgi:aspartyl-tRNA(Asn)/glutamyl-tRNA(Gln) amidotransferase subunit A
MLNVMKQPDARDWFSLPLDATDYTDHLEQGIRGLRVAYSPTLGYATVDAEVAQHVEAAVHVLQDLGAIVEQRDPGFSDPIEISVGLWFSVVHQLWAAMSPEQQSLTDPDFQAQAAQGAKYTFADIHRLQLRRAELGSMMRQFMQRYDVLVTPTVAIPAFEARAAGTVQFDVQQFLGWTPFSYPFNLTQQPAITVPCGLTRQGLPVGLQIVGPMFDDALVLRVAHAYESVKPVARPVI